MYSDEELIEELRRYEREYGRKPSENVFKHNPPSGYPWAGAYFDHFGSWSNAMVLAFGEATPFNLAKDEETAEIVERIRNGESAQQIANEQGISGQALRRRINRYCETYDVPSPLRRMNRK
jgi:Homing endonuclease associated repeat